MIKRYTLHALQKAINYALSLDEASSKKLQALQGRVVEVVVLPLRAHFFIYFTAKEMQLLDEYQGETHTRIESSPLGLIRLSVLPTSKVRSLFNDQVKLTGDVELGQQVKQLFDGLDIDWEGHLAQFTGDVVAFNLGSVWRKGLALKRQLTVSMQENLTEYLQEELRIVPCKEEIDDFFYDIETLSLQVERLEAHIHLLRAQHELD